ncbi:thioredoxin domain-containing protein [Corynebacterium sp. LK2522]|uniref:thioredoxin domain-containing protein n=1 Tax=Corynebacterium sp. LK2522 TaxID=3110474 RepID=UPI0034D02139
MSNSRKVTDPNASGKSGFLWGLMALLVIVAVVIGYIIWNGQSAKTDELADRAVDVNMDMQYEDNSVVLKSANAKDDAPVVDLYEDFSCPHCAELAVASDEKMAQAIEDGKMVVHIRTLNFMDGQDDPEKLDGYSTQAATAARALAEDGDVHAYWNLRKVLLEDQQDVARQWGAEEMAEAAKAFDASGDAVGEIKNMDLSAGQEFAAANYHKLEKDTGSVSSPRIFVDGEELELTSDLGAWVDQVAK